MQEKKAIKKADRTSVTPKGEPQQAD